jgi:polo-like kinase 4
MRFTTSPLPSQMHKMVHGQITIQPSRSLVIDLREGERRRGQKGDEVLVVNADGGMVRTLVYIIDQCVNFRNM